MVSLRVIEMMNRFLPVAIAALAIGASMLFGMFREYTNPDPNHTHADFAVWVKNVQMDFSGEEYMSEAYEEGKEVRVDPMRKFLHLHDGNGHVIHRHKPGLTLRDFMLSLGFADTCVITGVAPHNVAEHLCLIFPDGKTNILHLYVNGELSSEGLAYVFNDEDQILFTDSDDADIVERQRAMLTSQACMYSKTCPWRGDPPTENCIADPTVPCVIPE